MSEQNDKPNTLNKPGKLDPSTVYPLASLVEYGEDAVVSRTLAKGKVGTLTVFAFDAGQELSEHSAPFDAWVQVLEGEVTLTIGGEPYSASADQLTSRRRAGLRNHSGCCSSVACYQQAPSSLLRCDSASFAQPGPVS
ncbi:MAG: hypothetical protein CSA65_06570 [Proteobacteria bacterium]|nr:MAG: hypothetical protein CSA65_06570 [Pseudomonadota bacterium]